jgi:hypothetical protein
MSRNQDWEDVPLFDVPSVDDPPDMVKQVFDHWVRTVRNSGKGIKPVLSPERRRKIRKALEAYGMETCMLAIDGVLKSDFHMGRNAKARRYDDISLILRDARHIEMFAELAMTKDALTSFLDGE